MRSHESQDRMIVALYPAFVGLSPLLTVLGWFFVVSCSFVSLDEPVFAFGIACGILLLLFAKIVAQRAVCFDRRARVVSLPKRFFAPARVISFDDLLCVMTTTYEIRGEGFTTTRHWTIQLIEKQTETLLRDAVLDVLSRLDADLTALSTPRLTHAVEDFLFDGRQGRTLLADDTAEHRVVALQHALSTFAGLPVLDTCNDPPGLLSVHHRYHTP